MHDDFYAVSLLINNIKIINLHKFPIKESTDGASSGLNALALICKNCLNAWASEPLN